MLSYFNNRNLQSYIGLFLFSILVHLPGLLLPKEVFQESFFVQESFVKTFSIDYPYASFGLAYLFNLVITIALVELLKKVKLFENKSMLVPYAFLLFCGFSFSMMQFSPFHLILVGKITLIYIVFALDEMPRDKIPLNLFALGFMTGCLMLIDPYNLLYLVVIVFGLLLFKPSQAKDILVFMLGFVVVLFFIFSIYFIMDSKDSITSFFATSMHLSSRSLFYPFQPIYVLFFILIIGMVNVYSKYWGNTIFTRKCHQFFVVMLLVNVVLTLVNGKALIENAQNFGILFAIYVGDFLYARRKKWIQELVNGFLLLLLFWYQYDYYLPIKFEEIPVYLQ